MLLNILENKCCGLFQEGSQKWANLILFYPCPDGPRERGDYIDGPSRQLTQRELEKIAGVQCSQGYDCTVQDHRDCSISTNTLPLNLVEQLCSWLKAGKHHWCCLQ